MGGFAIWLDPFDILNPQIVVNLFPELGVGIGETWQLADLECSSVPSSSVAIAFKWRGLARWRQSTTGIRFLEIRQATDPVPEEESPHRHLPLSFSRGIRILISGVFVQV
jgi:hypothetical protein